MDIYFSLAAIFPANVLIYFLIYFPYYEMFMSHPKQDTTLCFPANQKDELYLSPGAMARLVWGTQVNFNQMNTYKRDCLPQLDLGIISIQNVHRRPFSAVSLASLG